MFDSNKDQGDHVAEPQPFETTDAAESINGDPSSASGPEEPSRSNGTDLPAQAAFNEEEPASTCEEESSSDDYKVGYGKPPLERRFKKGQSGNPSGRPAGRRRIKDLIAEEANRLVWQQGPEDIEQVPAFQAVMRAQFKLAMMGHGPAQRGFLKLALEADEEVAEEKAEPSSPKEQEAAQPDRMLDFVATCKRVLAEHNYPYMKLQPLDEVVAEWIKKNNEQENE